MPSRKSSTQARSGVKGRPLGRAEWGEAGRSPSGRDRGPGSGGTGGSRLAEGDRKRLRRKCPDRSGFFQ